MRRALLFIVLVAAGCSGDHPATSTRIEHPKFAASEANTRAHKMLEELEALPATERKNYLMAHSSELHAFADSDDPSLAARFRKDVRGK